MKKIYRLIAVLLLAIIAISVLLSCETPLNDSTDNSLILDDFSDIIKNDPESTQKNPNKKPSSNSKPNSNNNNNVNSTPTVSLEAYDYFPVISEEMPAIHIDTPNKSNTWATQYGRNDKNAGIIDYVDAFISVDNCEDVYLMNNVAAQVKVRGNYTLEYPKKPIRIKFTEKNNLLGLHNGQKYKNWILLADWKDLSMSNNTVAFYLGNTILGSNGYYCTDFRNVELYLNGEYWGVYLLVEQQEVEGNRTSVPKVENGYTGTDIGYFFEYDGYYAEERNMPNGMGDPTFVMDYAGISASQKGYTVKSDIYDNKQVAFLNNYMNKSYNIAYSAIFNNVYYKFNESHTSLVSASGEYESAKEAVASVIDLQSLVDIYILNEIACDADIAWSSFYMSLDMSTNGNKKITFEAPWDFDSCFGIKTNTCNNAQGLFAANSDNPWFKLVKGEDWFWEMVHEKWEEIKENGVPQAALDLVEAQKLMYSKNYVNNHYKWSQRLNGNGELIPLLNSYNDHITAQSLASDYLYDWLTKRFEYLDSVWKTTEKVEVDENIPEGAEKYRYEAEHATLTDGFDETSIRVNRSYASGNSYVGDVHKGRTIIFTVNASEDTTAYLFAGICKLTTKGDFGSWFDFRVNGEDFVLPAREVPALAAGEEEWHTFIDVKLAPIELVKGENTISFTAFGDTASFDYIDMYSTVELN